MILSLSNQLKYVIDYGEEWVPLRKELDHLKDYFYIIEVRFENRFELKIDAADDVNLEWPILKLALQPIVENAIQHGLRPQGRGTVVVAVKRIEDRIAVTVADDGIGIERTKLDALLARLKQGGAPADHVGMKNVHERLRSLCGESFGLSVSSRPHIGTSVTLEFPIKEVLVHDPGAHRG